MTSGGTPGEPVVELRGISVAFPGVEALADVSLGLFPGEVHALLGENGAGKSTVVKVLSGVQGVQAGEILVAGRPVRIVSRSDSHALGIGTAFQDIQLGPRMNVCENVMLGNEVRGRFGIDWRATRARARAQLDELGLTDLRLDVRLDRLSPPQQQLVAIARAMVAGPRVLLLDEPTSSLEAVDVARLFRVVRRLCLTGVAVLFISHFLEQALAISDRVTVLREGRVVGEYRPKDLDRPGLVSLMLGHELEELQRLGSERRAHQQEPEGDPVLVAQGVGRSGAMDATSLELFPCEIVGFAGLRGSGRTELARLISGTDLPDTGLILVQGRRLRPRRPGSGLRHRVLLSPEDRLAEGVISGLSVADNIVLSLQASRGWFRPVSRRERQELVEWWMERLAIDAVNPRVDVGTLSGGNQQKVLLARWLATRPRVLVLDEPTKGIDITSKLKLQQRVAQLADDGMAVVFISSELEEVLRIADRIVVLKDRQKIAELRNGPGVTLDTIVELIAAETD